MSLKTPVVCNTENYKQKIYTVPVQNIMHDMKDYSNMQTK